MGAAKWLSRAGGLLIALCLATPSWSSEGLSTAFADVTAEKIPLGVAYRILGPGQKGLVLKNLGNHTIRVRIEALIPAPSQLRRGAKPIPDPRWVDIRPSVVEIPAKSERESDILVTIPSEKEFRKHRYQVMIWSHATPVGEKGLTVSAGLLSRLQLKTAR